MTLVVDVEKREVVKSRSAEDILIDRRKIKGVHFKGDRMP